MAGQLSDDECTAALAEVEAAVLAHSPWIWNGLCRLGIDRPLHGDDVFLGFAPTAFAVLAGVSEATYAAAEAASGEELLRRTCMSYAEGCLAGGDEAPHNAAAAEIAAIGTYQMAAGGPAELETLARDALYTKLFQWYNEAGLQCIERRKAAARRLADDPSPHMAGFMTMMYGHVCAGCGERKKGTKLCSGCRSVNIRYCSRACQLSHWRAHKAECRAAAAARQE